MSRRTSPLYSREERFNKSSEISTVSLFIDPPNLDNENTNLNEIEMPPLQRNEVWDKENKASFIDNLLRGIPFGDITIGVLINGNEKISYLMDGRQRTSTIKSFKKNEFTLPCGLFYQELCDEDHELLNNTEILIQHCETTDSDLFACLFNGKNSGYSLVISEDVRGAIGFTSLFADYIRPVLYSPRFFLVSGEKDLNKWRNPDQFLLNPILMSRFIDGNRSALKYKEELKPFLIGQSKLDHSKRDFGLRNLDEMMTLLAITFEDTLNKQYDGIIYSGSHLGYGYHIQCALYRSPYWNILMENSCNLRLCIDRVKQYLSTKHLFYPTKDGAANTRKNILSAVSMWSNVISNVCSLGLNSRFTLDDVVFCTRLKSGTNSICLNTDSEIKEYLLKRGG